MSRPALRIGLVGYGFMGRTHSNAYAQVNRFFDVAYRPELKAVCGRDQAKAESFASQWGYESVETDWRALVERKDIDAIDIASPNDTHAPVAIAAAAAGKIVLCEKPLGRSLAEARQMVAAVERAGVTNMVWYNYRRVPAVTLAKQIIDEGKLGRIFHYRAKFLQDWTISAKIPQGGAGLWRLSADVAGSGVTGDLLAHCIDTALWLNGPMETVTAMTETFIKQRGNALTGEMQEVRIDDASAFLARFSNGSLATFEATRYARGHKALYTFEVNGENASLAWDLHDLHRLQFFRLRGRLAAAGLALDSRERRRASLHEAVVGAWTADRLRTHVYSPSGRLTAGFRRGRSGESDFPRRAGHRTSGGRGARIRSERRLGRLSSGNN